uniref:Uncharacterized protein n=1 Tax=Zea mays TaxID=4577 RepID=A0A804LY91_MAIZE
MSIRCLLINLKIANSSLLYLADLLVWPLLNLLPSSAILDFLSFANYYWSEVKQICMHLHGLLMIHKKCTSSLTATNENKYSSTSKSMCINQKYSSILLTAYLPDSLYEQT